MSDMHTVTHRKLHPYDSALEENLSMYDKLPYQRDSDLCNKESLGLVSGNVLKSYRLSISEPFEVKNMDDIITYKIAQVFNSSATPKKEEFETQENSDNMLAEALTAENYFPPDTDEDIIDYANAD